MSTCPVDDIGIVVANVSYCVSAFHPRALRLTVHEPSNQAHSIQEAQLWQRDRATLDTFSINVQRYSRNHRLLHQVKAYKITKQWNIRCKWNKPKANTLYNHAQNWIFGPPYGGIRSNICALSKILNKKKPCSRVLSPTNLFWYQKTRLITLSCCAKISAVCFFRFVKKHACDGQTDGQNYDPQDHTASCSFLVLTTLQCWLSEGWEKIMVAVGAKAMGILAAFRFIFDYIETILSDSRL